MRTHRDWFRSACLFCVLSWIAGLCAAQELEGMRSGVVKITARQDGATRVGSGFVVKREKDLTYILTAQHVVEGDQHPEVVFFDKRGKSFKARLVKADPLLDLAVLAVEGKDVPSKAVALLWASPNAVSLGAPVHTIGFSRGAGDWAVIALHVASTEGVMYRLAGVVDEGNSGGPVIREQRIVGVVKEVKGNYVHAVRGDIVLTALPSLGVQTETTAVVPKPAPDSRPTNPFKVEQALAKANIVLAEGDAAQQREWLKDDPAYQALAASCLTLLKGRRVIHAVPLDVINGFYMAAHGVSASDYLPPEKYQDLEKLKAAIFRTWRQRHADASRTSFEQIVERAPAQ